MSKPKQIKKNVTTGTYYGSNLPVIVQPSPIKKPLKDCFGGNF